MSKEQHDKEAAATRPVSYEKQWFKNAAGLMAKAGISGGKALDLACGNGEFSEIMRDRFQMEVTCLDYVDHYVEQARQRGFEAHQLDLETADLLDPGLLPDLSGRFDLVVLLEAIEHVFDTEHLLSFVHRLLRPGGRVLVSTPNMGFIGYRLYAAMHGNVPFGEGHHVRFFDEKRLRAYLYLTGFESERAATAHYDGVMPVRRIFTKRSWLPVWLGKAIAGAAAFPPGRWLLPAKVRQQGLVMMVQRAETTPMALFWRRTKEIVEACSTAQKPLLVTRLCRARALGYLDEHPGFQAYVAGLEGEEKVGDGQNA